MRDRYRQHSAECKPPPKLPYFHNVVEFNVPLDTSKAFSEMSLSSQSLGNGTEKKPTTTKINRRNPKMYTRNLQNQTQQNQTNPGLVASLLKSCLSLKSPEFVLASSKSNSSKVAYFIFNCIWQMSSLWQFFLHYFRNIPTLLPESNQQFTSRNFTNNSPTTFPSNLADKPTNHK